MRLIQSPVAAANEDRNAIDGDGQRVGAGNAVGDLADAESHVLRVGDLAPTLEAEMQLVEILRAVAVRPPEARMLDVQRRRVFRIEGHNLLAVRRQRRPGCSKEMFFDGALRARR